MAQRDGRYPFRPELVTPSTMCRWKSTKTARTGRAPRTAEAITSAQCAPKPDAPLANPTGIVIVFVELSTSSGHRKLLHVHTKVKIATAEMAGSDSGMYAARYSRNQLAPSMRAASPRLGGCRGRMS